jgi:hypothetical protein
MTRITAKKAKELGLEEAPKRKYHNTICVADGIKFDSVKESRKYTELVLLQKAGEVAEIKLQPVYVLQEGFKRGKRSFRPITYKADFEVTYTNGRVQVIDVKGYKTEVYKIKKKLFLAKYPNLEFEEC